MRDRRAGGIQLGVPVVEHSARSRHYTWQPAGVIGLAQVQLVVARVVGGVEGLGAAYPAVDQKHYRAQVGGAIGVGIRRREGPELTWPALRGGRKHSDALWRLAHGTRAGSGSTNPVGVRRVTRAAARELASRRHGKRRATAVARRGGHGPRYSLKPAAGRDIG